MGWEVLVNSRRHASTINGALMVDVFAIRSAAGRARARFERLDALPDARIRSRFEHRLQHGDRRATLAGGFERVGLKTSHAAGAGSDWSLLINDRELMGRHTNSRKIVRTGDVRCENLTSLHHRRL